MATFHFILAVLTALLQLTNVNSFQINPFYPHARVKLSQNEVLQYSGGQRHPPHSGEQSKFSRRTSTSVVVRSSSTCSFEKKEKYRVNRTDSVSAGNAFACSAAADGGVIDDEDVKYHNSKPKGSTGTGQLIIPSFTAIASRLSSTRLYATSSGDSDEGGGDIESGMGDVYSNSKSDIETTVAAVSQIAAEATFSSSVINLLKNCLGAGVFSLGYRVLSISGDPKVLFPAAFVVYGMAIWATYNFYLVGEICRMSKSSTFGDAWSKTVSENTRWIVQFIVTVSPLVSCLANTIVLTDVLTGMVRSAAPQQAIWFYGNRNLVISALTTFILFPLCIAENLGALKKVSIFGILGQFSAMGAFAWRFFDRSYAIGGVFSSFDFNAPKMAKNVVKAANVATVAAVRGSHMAGEMARSLTSPVSQNSLSAAAAALTNTATATATSMVAQSHPHSLMVSSAGTTVVGGASSILAQAVAAAGSHKAAATATTALLSSSMSTSPSVTTFAAAATTATAAAASKTTIAAAAVGSGIGATFAPGKWLVLMSLLSYCFVCHYNAPRYYAELKGKEQDRNLFAKMTLSAYLGAATTYLGTIALTIFLFGKAKTASFALNSFSPTDPLAIVALSAFGASVLASYPLIFLTPRNWVKGQVANFFPALSSTKIVTAVLLSGIAFLTSKLRDIGVVGSISGGIFGSSMMFIFPPIMYVRALWLEAKEKGTPVPRGKILLNLVLLFAGSCLGIFGTFNSLKASIGAR